MLGLQNCLPLLLGLFWGVQRGFYHVVKVVLFQAQVAQDSECRDSAWGDDFSNGVCKTVIGIPGLYLPNMPSL